THGVLPLLPYVNLHDAISDLIDSPGQHSVYTERIASFFNYIPPGGNWRNLTEEQKKDIMGASYNAGGGKTGFLRRLSWDSPSPTLTTKPNRKGSALCHPDRTRPLSVREYMRIQGFPDDWILVGSMSQKYQQIGNAVPTHLGKSFGDFIASEINLKRRKVLLNEKELTRMTDDALIKLRSYAKNNIKKNTQQLELFNGTY
ncbi:MAG: DNA cytosine methyltransferase, partial [Chloroflexota bacterium]